MRTRNVANPCHLWLRAVFKAMAMVTVLSSTTVADQQPVAPLGYSDRATNRALLKVDFEAEPLTGWSLLAEAGATGQVQREFSPRGDNTNSHSLRLTVMNPGRRCGVCNEGQPGFSVPSGGWYDLAFAARSEQRENNRGYGLTVSLESEDGGQVLARTTIPEVGGDWKNYTVALHAYAAGSKARLVITLSEPGTIWLDDVSLTAREPHTGPSR